VSLVAHVGLLLGLGLVGLPEGPTRQLATPIETVPIADEAEPQIDLSAVAASDEPQDAPGANSEAGDAVAQAVAAVAAEESLVPVESTEDPTAEVPIEPLETLPTGLEADATMVVKGAVGVGTTGASGAVDRLTIEIATALEQRPVLVCWVFDRSVSLAAQRQEIAGRLERVFTELGADGSERNRPDLVHLVFGYGQNVRAVFDEPTRDPATVVDAIRTIDIDDVHGDPHGGGEGPDAAECGAAAERDGRGLHRRGRKRPEHRRADRQRLPVAGHPGVCGRRTGAVRPARREDEIRGV
jgi:hypothetical protein